MSDPLDQIDQVNCRPADCRQDFEQAFRLLYDRYLESKLTRPNCLKMRVVEHQLWSECQILVAEQNRRIVGTVSLVADGSKGLPVDSVFADVLRNYRKDGVKLVEVGCLAASAGAGQFHSPIFLSLTRATIHYSRSGEFDLMIAAVHPRHCRFYERGMGFQRLSKVASYESVEGNAAICVAGNPNAPLEYRQPWRGLFFGGRSQHVFQETGCRMSAADRRYFAGLCEHVGQDDVRRAA